MFSTIGASLLIQLCNIVTGVVLARVLGPTGRGELVAVMIWPTVLSILASVGLTEAISYHAARRVESLRTLAGTALVLAAAGSVAACLAGYVLLPVVLADARPEVIQNGQLYLCQIPLTLGALYLMAALNGRGRFVAFNALRILQFLGTTLLLAVVASLDALTIRTAVEAYLLAGSITLVATYACVARDLKRDRKGSVRYRGPTARLLLSFGIRSYSGTVPSVLNQRLDQLLISAFLAPRQLGLYAIGVTLTSLTSLVGTSLAYVVLPAIAAAPAEQRLTQLRGYILVGLALAAASAVPVFIATGLLLSFFFGTAFEDAAAVTRILLIGTVLWAGSRIVEAGLRGLNRPLEAGTGELIALGVTVILLPVLLSTAGIVGASLASVIAYATSFGWLIRRAAARLEVSARSLVKVDRSMLSVALDLARRRVRTADDGAL